jgi:integrase
MTFTQILPTLQKHLSLNPSLKQVERTDASLPKGVSIIAYRNGKFSVNLRAKDPLTSKRVRFNLGDCAIDSEQDIWAKYYNIKQQLDAGVSPEKPSSTVDSFVNSSYLPHVKACNSSWKCDQGRYMHHVRAVLGNTPLHKVTTHQITQLLDSMMAQGYKPATRNRVLALIRHMMVMAVEWGFVSHNAASKIKLLKEHNQSTYVLNDEDVAAITTAIDNGAVSPVVGGVVKLQVALGLRISEVLRLKKHDVDFTNRLITITKTKNGKVRVLPLSDFAIGVFEQMQAFNGNSVFVFPSPKSDDKHITLPHRTVQKLKQAAGLTRFKSHDLRRYFASTAVNQGATLLQASVALGHVSTAITQQRYAFVNAPSLVSVMNTVGSHLSQI